MFVSLYTFFNLNGFVHTVSVPDGTFLSHKVSALEIVGILSRMNDKNF
jgi:hypothetical protein